MPEIGNLLVSLQMETASFNKGIADTNKKLDAFGKRFDGVSKGIAGAAAGITKALGALGLAMGAVAAIKGIAGWAKSMADAGEAVGNLATALGLSENQVIQLQGVFALTTGTLAEASGAMRVFVGHIADATAKAGPARESFAAIGVSLADLKAKGNDPMAMLKLVADQMAKFNDDAFKSAIGADLFGKAWEKIAPIMKDGAAGIDEASKRANELDPAAREAAAAGDALDKKMDELNKTIQGLSNEGFLFLKQAIFGTVDAIQSLVSTGSAIVAWARSTAQGIAQTLNSMADAYVAFRNRVAEKITGGPNFEFAIPPPLSNARSATAAEQASRPRPSVVPPPGGGGGGGRKKGGGGGGGGKSGDADAKRLEREAERARKDAQRETIEAAEEQNRLSDERFRRAEQALKHDLAMEKVTKQESIAAEEKMLEAKWAATQGFYAKKRAAAVADKDETRKLQSEENLEYERFLTEREALTQESALETRNKWKEVFSDLGDSIKTSLGGAFDQILEGTFKLRDAIGNLLKDIGKKLASKAMDKLFDMGSNALLGGVGSLFGGGSSGGIPGSLAGAFAGAKTSKLDFSGYATGGSFRVGGAGALDSQLVAFRASPGEMVDVSRPGDARRGAGETIRIDLNPSEGWVAGVADQRIVTRSGQIVEVAVRQSQRTVARNFGGMSAEAQARQL